MSKILYILETDTPTKDNIEQPFQEQLVNHKHQ